MKAFPCTFSLALVTLLFSVTAQADNISVDCRPGAKGTTTISAAVAAIAKKAAAKAIPPSTITVTGPCVENVTVASLDNLTLQASPSGASISDASSGNLDTVAVGTSNRFVLNGFTINGSVDCFDNSFCTLQGNTIQNSQTGYGLRSSRSRVDSVSDSISNNPSGAGILDSNQSVMLLIDDTVSNNAGNGIVVEYASLVQMARSSTTTTVSNNAGHGVFATAHGTVRLNHANVTGNANDGIRVQDGSVLHTDFVAPRVNDITGNGGAGVNLGDLAHAFFANDGSINVTGNLSGPDVYCAGQFAATRNVASTGGTTNCVEPNPESPKRK
ncbi:MAG TPA: right-handed parallel beta-helix repeat-containing protein [Terriglobales bacterium]